MQIRDKKVGKFWIDFYENFFKLCVNGNILYITIIMNYTLLLLVNIFIYLHL
jgi:hypothetical protein